MADLYVQVEEGLPGSRLVDALREIGLDTDQAIGKLVRLWLATLKLGTAGKIGDRSDAWIEEAVGWRGQPGAFARVIRDRHCDGHGKIREWLDKYGALEAARASARNRQQASRLRRRHGDGHSDGAGDGHAELGVTPLSSSSSVSSLSREKSAEQEQEQEQHQEIPNEQPGEYVQPGEWSARGFSPVEVVAVLGFIRASDRPYAVWATLRNLADGEMGESKRTPAVLARACLDYQADTKASAEGFKPFLFRRFCDHAERELQRAVGRERNDAEGSYVSREGKAAQQRDREARAAKVVLDDFARDYPERYDELSARAAKDVADDLGVPFDIKNVAHRMTALAKLTALVRQDLEGRRVQ